MLRHTYIASLALYRFYIFDRGRYEICSPWMINFPNKHNWNATLRAKFTESSFNILERFGLEIRWIVCDTTQLISKSLFCAFQIWRHRDSNVRLLVCVYGPRLKFRWGRDFPQTSKTALGFTQPTAQWVSYLFPGGKAAEMWRWSPTPSNPEVKERAELYLYYPSTPSWRVVGWTLPFTCTLIIFNVFTYLLVFNLHWLSQIPNTSTDLT